MLAREAAPDEALHLLGGSAPADDQVIELLMETAFDDESGFDDGEFRAAGTVEPRPRARSLVFQKFILRRSITATAGSTA